ncbi:MAG TPA: SDR family NAD(P)-dependent oxidoreductase [Acidimicrobiales bacterium]|nr:SDR family NAD(P)-dependent oxidoreductase [Acidimicrobiales bacterium]
MARSGTDGRGWSWPGKVVIVTGASSGIGAALAEDLGTRGATVVGVARRREQLEAVMARAGGGRAAVADLAEKGASEAVVATTEAEHGRVDVLVNNAAIPMRVHATRLTTEQVRRAMDVNFLTAVRTTLAALPGMLGRHSGHVVNVSSVGGRVVSPREAAYVASKFAMVGWTDAMAADLTGTGVRMHLMYPGPIATEIWDKLDEPASFSGRFYPPQRVSAAIVRMVERDRFEGWVPRRMSALVFVRAALPRLFVESAGRFDRRAESRR